MHRIWQAYLLASSVVVAGYLLVPLGVARDAVYVAVGLAAAAAVLGGVRRWAPVRPAPWRCIALGQLTWTAGDATYGWLEHVRHVEPFPSAADAFYLSAYGLYVTAFVLLLRGRTAGRDREGLLDSAIVTTAVALLSWTTLIGPAALASGDPVLHRGLGLAYPLADVLVFALLARLLSTPGGRTPAFRLLLAGGLLVLTADIAFALVTLTSSYGGGALDLVWLSAYCLMGAAALHPSMRSLSEPVAERPVSLTRRRLVLLTLAGLTAPGTLAVQLLLGGDLDAWAVVVGSVVMFLLVTARMAGLLRRLQAQAGELDELSRTDPLTGLPNRRSADAELGRALARAERTGDALVVAMVDLDRFKAFNDTFGHQAGDRLLSSAASVWRALLPAGCVLARFGGEEFVLLRVGGDRDDALALLARMRAATPAGQTFSAGAATWDRAETAQALLHRADVALYAAKRAGRDRVLVADEALPV